MRAIPFNSHMILATVLKYTGSVITREASVAAALLELKGSVRTIKAALVHAQQNVGPGPCVLFRTRFISGVPLSSNDPLVLCCIFFCVPRSKRLHCGLFLHSVATAPPLSLASAAARRRARRKKRIEALALLGDWHLLLIVQSEHYLNTLFVEHFYGFGHPAKAV